MKPRSVGGEPFLVHAGEYGDELVDVVVELDVVFVVVGAEKPADVLDDSAFERDREGEEQGVEGGPVESFAEVGAGGDEYDAAVSGGGKFVDDASEGFLAGSAAELEW